MSESADQGQGHRIKKRVYLPCSRMVCIRLKGNLVAHVF